jgi:hypothetical protein
VTETYNLSIPCLIDSSQVFSCFFDQGQHDQTEELIRDACFHYIFDPFDQEHGEQGNNGKGKDESHNTLGERKLWLSKIIPSVEVSVLISL